MTSVNRPADVPLLDLLVSLRAALGIAPIEMPVASHVPRNVDVSATLVRFDRDEWIRWCLATAPLFSDGAPSYEATRDAAAQTAIVMAVDRAGGSLTNAARRLHSSRRVVRENLKKANLYPWRR